MINKLGKQETLCWYCAHAVPEKKKGHGCPWSLGFQPVRGWQAEPKIYRTGKKICGTSYFVMDCPLFREG